MGRAAASVADSTSVTYVSHINMISWACSVLGVSLCPAPVAGIRKVAVVCNNPMTLRGWLAAWRRLRVLRGVKWEGDGDSLLRAVRAGTSRRLPLGPPKRRVRISLLMRLLKAAIQQKEFLVGAACCLAYVFALRVPSELLAQGRRGQLKVFPDRV